jgi:hypothetical protein
MTFNDAIEAEKIAVVNKLNSNMTFTIESHPLWETVEQAQKLL